MNRLFESSLLNQVAASSLRVDYTPLLTAKAQPEQKDLVVKDEKRSREIPIRVYLPTDQAAAPVEPPHAALRPAQAMLEPVGPAVLHALPDDGVCRSLSATSRKRRPRLEGQILGPAPGSVKASSDSRESSPSGSGYTRCA